MKARIGYGMLFTPVALLGGYILYLIYQLGLWYVPVIVCVWIAWVYIAVTLTD
jgi:hypothetical protein